MRTLLTFLTITILSGCGFDHLIPRTISSTELGVQEKLIFEVDVSQVVSATKEVFAQKGWKILYEGSELPKKDYSLFSNAEVIILEPIPIYFSNYDHKVWIKLLRSSNLEPKHFITGKIRTSAVISLGEGSELFIIVFESPKSGSVVSVAISTNSRIDKKNLETYLNEYTELLNNYID